MKNNWDQSNIGDIVSALPAAAEVFKKHNIDYCCGGQRMLSKVLSEEGHQEKDIYDALDILKEKSLLNERTNDLGKLTHEDLSMYIESRHHSYIWEALPQISGVFSTVLKAHGKNHPELFDLHRIFSRLRGELEQHLIKEEAMLFPGLKETISEETRRLSAQIKKEHEEAGKALKELRQISHDYLLPPGACMTYQKLYTMLEELEGDLHQHIHLENNILLVDV